MKLEVPDEEAADGDGHLHVEKAKQALAAAARCVDAADYSTLQAVCAACTVGVGGLGEGLGPWMQPSQLPYWQPACCVCVLGGGGSLPLYPPYSGTPLAV